MLTRFLYPKAKESKPEPAEKAPTGAFSLAFEFLEELAAWPRKAVPGENKEVLPEWEDMYTLEWASDSGMGDDCSAGWAKSITRHGCIMKKER